MNTNYLKYTVLAAAVFTLVSTACEAKENAARPGASATSADTATELISQEVAAACKAYLKRHPDVKGGPGLSPATAWVMPADPDANTVRMEYQILQRVFGCSSSAQALVGEGNRTYDVLNATYTDKAGAKHKIQVWFDITDYFAAFSESLGDEEDEVEDDED